MTPAYRGDAAALRGDGAYGHDVGGKSGEGRSRMNLGPCSSDVSARYLTGRLREDGERDAAAGAVRYLRGRTHTVSRQGLHLSDSLTDGSVR